MIYTPIRGPGLLKDALRGEKWLSGGLMGTWRWVDNDGPVLRRDAFAFPDSQVFQEMILAPSDFKFRGKQTATERREIPRATNTWTARCREKGSIDFWPFYGLICMPVGTEEQSHGALLLFELKIIMEAINTCSKLAIHTGE
jgi:hypothetical protein